MRALKEGKFIVVNHVSETEETTSSYELAESLLFNLRKNQFTWSGSPHNFESFMLRKLGFSSPDILSKTSNGTCTVWKTANVTLTYTQRLKPYWLREKWYMYNLRESRFAKFAKNLYNLAQMKAPPLLQMKQFTSHDTPGQEADDQQEEELNLMADEKSDSDAKDGGTSCFLNSFQTTTDSNY